MQLALRVEQPQFKGDDERRPIAVGLMLTRPGVVSKHEGAALISSSFETRPAAAPQDEEITSASRMRQAGKRKR